MRSVGPGPGTRVPLVACLLASIACGGGSPVAPTPMATPTPTPPPPSARVVIISIDGLRAEALTRTSVPNISALAARGASTYQAQTIMPATTLPSHSSMLSGYSVAQHGINWDDWQAAKGLIRVPTVFQHANDRGLRSVMLVGKEKFKHLQCLGGQDTFKVMAPDDAAIANEAITQMATDFRLMFVHLPQVDLTGHELGWMSASYLAQVSRTDLAVGAIVAALPPATTVILTADHGGNGRTHGANPVTDVPIPWIAVGPRVPQGRLLQGRVTTYDTAATAAMVLGLTLAADVVGRPVSEAFAPAAPTASH